MLRKLESSREEAFSKGFELISVPLIFGHPKSWTFSVPLIFGQPQPKIKGSRKFMGIRYLRSLRWNVINLKLSLEVTQGY